MVVFDPASYEIVEPELPVLVFSPACETSVVEDCASVKRPGGDCGGGASGAEVDGVARCVCVGGCSVSKLPDLVPSPAFDGAVVEDCASVIMAGGDCGGGASGAEVDGVAGCFCVGVCSVADRAVIGSPACDGAVVEDCASVKRPGGDCGGGASGAEVDGVAGCFYVGGCSVSKLPDLVPSPAFDGAVVEDCASVKRPGGDCDGGASGAEVDGVAGCFCVGVCSVSKLTCGVSSPAFDGAVVEDCTSVIIAGGDCGGGASGAEVDGVAGCVGAGVCSVSELAVSVISPAFDGAVVKDCTCVIEARGDCGGGASGAEVDGVAWCVGVVVCSITELPPRVITPAFQ